MGSGHSHAVLPDQSERPLWIALILTTAFLVVEIIGGVLTNSLALVSDAAHMFTDTAALAISLAAIRIGRRPADSERTLGDDRFEILAAAFNAILRFLVAVYILYEAYQRLHHPPEIQSGTMLLVAAFGLVINLISMRMLSSGKDSSLNVKGAYLEVWSDMLGSIGVIIGALIIRYTGLDLGRLGDRGRDRFAGAAAHLDTPEGKHERAARRRPGGTWHCRSQGCNRSRSGCR